MKGRSTALRSRSNLQTCCLALRRRPFSLLFGTRLRVVTSGTITTAGTTRCELCARSLQSQRLWPQKRSHQRPPTLTRSRLCDTSSRRLSNSVALLTQSGVSLLSTRVSDGDHRLGRRRPHRGSRRLASSQKRPFLHDMTLRRLCVHHGVPLRLLQNLRTHGRTLIPLRYRTQCHGRNRQPRALHVVHHAITLIAHSSSLSVIPTRMM